MMLRNLVLAGSAVLLLAACSSGDTSGTSSDGAASSAPASTSSGSPSGAASSPGSSASPEVTEILAVLCDSATPEQVTAIEAALKPEFTVSQLIDVRTDDDGSHAILGFVEGPGMAVLAQWTGTGLTLEGLAAAEDLAAEVSSAPLTKPDADTQKLVEQTVTCYSSIFAPDDSGDKDDKNDDKNDDKKDDKKDD